MHAEAAPPKPLRGEGGTWRTRLPGKFTLSDTGALVYVRGGALPRAERVLAWVDRNGRSQTLEAPPHSKGATRARTRMLATARVAQTTRA